jgi:hypothetical protein
MKYGCSLLMAMLAASLSVPALADPPQKGAERIIFNLPVIICDTRAQIQDIFEASQVNLENGLNTAFVKWYKVMNTANEHTCNMMQVMFLHIYESAKLGIVDSSVNAMPAWAVHAGNDTTDAWALYFEPHRVNEWRAHPVVTNGTN